jgi:hypothetical protein
MNPYKINDVFTQNQIDYLTKTIDNTKKIVDKVLGRAIIKDIKNSFTEDIVNRLHKISKEATGLSLSIDHAFYAEYNKRYGMPNLPPHFDRDKNCLIINFQLSANTSWDLGLNKNIYKIEDNSAVLFDGNAEVHWRPHKVFKEGEYVKMIFIRFFNPKNIIDNSHLETVEDNDFFKNINVFRDSSLTDI